MDEVRDDESFWDSRSAAMGVQDETGSNPPPVVRRQDHFTLLRSVSSKWTGSAVGGAQSAGVGRDHPPTTNDLTSLHTPGEVGMQQERANPPGNTPGNLSLILGIVSFAITFVPVVGELVAVAVALAAITLGLIGFGRSEKGLADNLGQSIAGIFLGALVILIALIFLAATMTHGP